jgi:hypothetical protein
MPQHLPVFTYPLKNSIVHPPTAGFAFHLRRLAAKSRATAFTMTVFLPLQEGTATPPVPSFLCPASEPTDYWKRVIKAILKAKHIAVVCGEHLEVT